MVGLSGVPAGAVGEVAALSVWVLRSAGVPFGDGGLRTSGVARSTSPGLWIFGSAVLSNKPHPDPCRRRIWILKMVWKIVMLILATVLEFRGAGSSEPMSGDFPAAMGLAPDDQGVRLGSRGSRSRASLYF
jgi:hypothetical protein